MSIEHHLPGIWKLRIGSSETATPVSLRNLPPRDTINSGLDDAAELPFDPLLIESRVKWRGMQIVLPAGEDEQFYGLGLQLRGLNHRGKKRTLRVNSDPTVDLGDSHAPAPFYVSTAGYGVLIDTARYATFYFGTTKLVSTTPPALEATMLEVDDDAPVYKGVASGRVEVDIPSTVGVDVYLFAGPSMLDAVRRYVMFSGGGPVLPRWGLGVWYRGCGTASQERIAELATELRESRMPCDVFGLEPGWQSKAYSCSHVWDAGRYPSPTSLLDEMSGNHYRVNNWTHAFTHPSSPIYDALVKDSGDHEVWNGLVPDFTLEAARETFGKHYDESHVALGVSGYKLDECDSSDFMKEFWSFPETSVFPSELDGEQYHSLFGIKFQETIDAIFRRRGVRSFQQVRNSHALSAPYPFALYSDLYDHDEFIRGVANAGFSGMLWCPEVRHAEGKEDLIRRLQTTVFSPMAQVNAWYINHPPWKQWSRTANNSGQFLVDWPEIEDACREVLEWRMRFLPYLYAAFVAYELCGTPPFRALVLDYPHDAKAQSCDDQYMMGDRILVAPITAKRDTRDVYLPEGQWRDFWTGELFDGGVSITVTPSLETIPLFVKDGSIVPLARPTLYTDDPAALELTARVYGSGASDAVLFEDDGVSYPAGARNSVTLSWDGEAVALTRAGDVEAPAYTLTGWELIVPE
ncbi:MAG TPA: TIM-barrel domain-containing protein [Capsulimonadaceae bacterium]|jgi:alpha-D-xyloside xylohydrolase